MNRRTVLGILGAGAVPIIGAGLRGDRHTLSQELLATPIGSPEAATPVAAGSPAASPVATPIPSPLEIIREREPQYGSSPRRGGTLRMLRPAAAQLDFNPTSYRQDYQVFVSYLDPLLRPDPLSLEPEPWLAESWQVSADGCVITFQLRTDVRWHDGTPFTARDVRFSLLAYRDDFDTGVGNLFITLDQVDVIDEFEVRVMLAVPDPSWLFNAATQLMFHAARYEAYWASLPPGERSLTGFDHGQQPPVGTGPWRIESITDDGLAFVRNDDYWLDPPWFERFTLGWQDNRRDRIDAWRTGTTDIVWPLRSEDIRLVDDLPGRLYVADAASVMFAAFNFANPTGLPRFFDDSRLRAALNLAVDRERYAAEIFKSFTNEMATGTIAQPWAHDEERRSPAHDPGAALEQLAAAGWVDANGDGMLENANGVPFDLTVIVRDDARRELIQVLRSVKEDWAAIGVALRIQLLPADEFQARAIRGHDYDLIAYAYDLYPGFTDFDLYGSAWDVRINPQGWNPGGYANADADLAIAAFFQATEVVAQRRALFELQRVVDEDLFGIWLGFPAHLILCAIDLDGLQPNKLWPTADTRLLWRTDRTRPVDAGESGGDS